MGSLSEAEAIHTETETFWAIHTELVAQYAGQHVAMYKGQVVDHDLDVVKLALRIRKRFGTEPVLIAPVKPGPRRDLQWRGVRLPQREIV